MKRRAVWISLLFLFSSIAYAQQSAPIAIDGDFRDWTNVNLLCADPTGDGSPQSPDLGRAWVCDDGSSLFLRIETRRETLWQGEDLLPAGNDLRLYIDGDNSPATGKKIDGIGVDMEIHLGGRKACLHDDFSLKTNLNEIGFIAAPTHTSSVFEMRIPFVARPGFEAEQRVIPGPEIAFFIRDGENGDRLPDKGVLPYVLANRAAPAPDPVPLDRLDDADVRILVHNVWKTNIAHNPRPFYRFLKALEPDIINYQEVDKPALPTQDAQKFVANTLPLPAGQEWHAAHVDDCLTLSRWPIVASSRVDDNLVCLIDLPDEISEKNLVVFNAHTPAGNRDEERDVEHDRIAAAWRDMLNGAGLFPIDPNDAVIMCGDFNMVGYKRQLDSLRVGDIFDNARHGPDFAPGREAGSLVSAPLRHTHTRLTYTWRKDRASYAPGKLDYIFFSPDSAQLKRNFALWTPDMPEDTLKKYGLKPDDSPAASDHLPLIADFDFR